MSITSSEYKPLRKSQSLPHIIASRHDSNVSGITVSTGIGTSGSCSILDRIDYNRMCNNHHHHHHHNQYEHRHHQYHFHQHPHFYRNHKKHENVRDNFGCFFFGFVFFCVKQPKIGNDPKRDTSRYYLFLPFVRRRCVDVVQYETSGRFASIDDTATTLLSRGWLGMAGSGNWIFSAGNFAWTAYGDWCFYYGRYARIPTESSVCRWVEWEIVCIVRSGCWRCRFDGD